MSDEQKTATPTTAEKSDASASTAERIASALERIAAALEASQRPSEPALPTAPARTYLGGPR